MLAAKRIEKIKEIMLECKHIEIPSLSSILSVSEATIRRDLEKLEEDGFLKRTYGGAVLNEQVISETSGPTCSSEYIPNYEEKKLIGNIAAQLVDNNEVIIIGSGTTCLQFARSLKDKKDLTVVTNNLLISEDRSIGKNMKVILTGGDIFEIGDSKSLVGEFAHRMLENIHVSKAFLSVDGVDMKSGYTANNSELALAWKKMADAAGEVIILGDYTKFGKQAFISLGPLNMAHKVITNEEVPEGFIKHYFESGIPIYTSYQIQK